MDTSELFAIGDVARLFHISVSSLRHYENIGLLKPEFTDPQTGYRYYSARQFEVLNTIRYLRVLDMPLSEIADFLSGKDVDVIEEKLHRQKAQVIAKQQELRRIERKIDNRLRQLSDAQNSEFDVVKLVRKPSCRMVWIMEKLRINSSLDMEAPMRRLESAQAEPLVFLGKVGLGISPEHLSAGEFGQYDGLFLLLDDEDNFNGDTKVIPEQTYAAVRFHGSHAESPEQYKMIMRFIEENELEAIGFSQEITMIDCGITNDTDKFVTEIAVPVAKKRLGG